MASNQSSFEPLCEAAHDRLADLLDGTAPVEIVDHLAVCDRCRDLRHDASRLAALVSAAGDDYQPPADLEARLFAALETRPAPSADGGGSPGTTHDTHVSALPLLVPPPGSSFGATYPSSPGGPTSGIVSSAPPAPPDAGGAAGGPSTQRLAGGPSAQPYAAGVTAGPSTQPLAGTAGGPSNQPYAAGVTGGGAAPFYATGSTGQTGAPAVSAAPATFAAPAASAVPTANGPARPGGPAAKRAGSARQRALRAWAREYRLPLLGLVASVAAAAV
ncbi:MAG TPA: hypothetical protein VFS00_01895, partial [Polyangiaceae bacterium]|nr:hypothetical protein [Polyangiaceae bacterium]